MDSAETDSPALSRVDYKVVTCCRCGYATRRVVLAKGAGCLGHWPVGIQNREHVADAGLAVGSDRRRWTSIMTKEDFRGCGGKAIWRMMTSFSTLYCDNKLREPPTQRSDW